VESNVSEVRGYFERSLLRGKVVKFKLRRGRQPVGKVLCLPEGATKPSKCA